MAELKCTCGAVLDPDPEFCHAEMADGTKYARCPNCDVPYKVPKGKVEKVKPEPDPDPEPETEPGSETEPETEPTEPPVED